MHIATNKRLRPTLSILDYFGIRRVFNSIYAIDSGDAIFTGKAEMLAVQINKENIKINLFLNTLTCIFLPASPNALFVMAIKPFSSFLKIRRKICNS